MGSVTRGSFAISRTVQAPVAKVWTAFADAEAKEKWFKGPDSAPDEHTMDFRIGGHEHNQGKFHDGTEHQFEATYYDIVPNARIIYTYEMYIDGSRISVSLAIIEFQDLGGATQVTISEDGAFLDGFDKPEIRQQGTIELFNALIRSVEEN